jgi:hypothetical protein
MGLHDAYFLHARKDSGTARSKNCNVARWLMMLRFWT